MVMMVSPVSVNFNAPPEINYSRRSFIPLGEVGNFAKSSGEFTPEELEVIKKTPFLASRIEAAADKGTIIGYRDAYKNRADILEARQAYNLAVNNPREFYKSEFPAYLGSNDVDAATKLVQSLYDAGETPESIGSLYETAVQTAPEYSQTYAEKVAINMATQGSNDPLGISDYIKPFFTTVGAIAGGPIGAAVVNSLVQLGQTGKIDPKETATAAAAAYIGEQLTAPTDTSVGGTPGVSEVYPVDMSVGGTVTPLPPVDMTLPSYGLLDGVTFPSQGLQVPPSNVSTLPPSLADGVGSPGLQAPTMPTIPGMGGTGVTIPVEGGTIGAGGFTPEGAVPVIGDPGSFINDPNVIGQPVINVDTSAISLRDAFDAARGINRVSGLLGGGGGQAVGGVSDPGQMPAGSVDVSRLLSLLSGANVRTPNVYSLLG